MITQDTVAQAQAAGIELGPELGQEVEVLQSTIQEPVEKEPVVVPKSEVETKLEQAFQNQEAPKQDEPEENPDGLAWLDLPEDVGLEEPAKDPLELPETPEAKKFAEDFKQYLGFDVAELRDGIGSFKQMQQEIESYRAQKAVDTQLRVLKQEWQLDGAEFDARMQKVVERFNKYPPEMKAKLDSTEGVKLIAAKIEQEEAAKQRKPSVPTFERSRGQSAPSGSKPMFTQAEIDSMDLPTYEKMADKIQYAYVNGLVAKG